MKKFMKKQWMFSMIVVLFLGLGMIPSTKAYYYDDDYNYEQTDAKVAENAYIKSIGNTSATTIELTISCPEADQSISDNFYYDGGYYDWNADRVKIYRSNKENGEYKLIKSASVSSFVKNGYIIYKDTSLTSRTIYYYKAQLECVDSSGKSIDKGEMSDPVGACTMGKAPKFKKIKAIKAKTFKATWNKGSDMDGMDVYIIGPSDAIMNDFYLNEKGSYVTVGTAAGQIDLDSIKPVKSYSINKTSCTYKKAEHGYMYYFALRPYVKINGEKIQSKSVYVQKKAMDYYFCPNATDSKFFVKRPKSQKKCAKMMKTIKVKTWEYADHQKHKGKKITKTLYIQLNKTLAPTVKQIYKEIYKDPSKPVIYEAGSYRWREGETDWSYHTIGAAIDMNVNENPYYVTNAKGKRVRSVGSFYKPKTNPYSIPRNGVVEQTFNKYGFYRLDFDLMHFEAHIEKGRW